MKKIIYLLAIGCVLVACNNKNTTDILTLKGKIEGYNTNYLYLYEVQNEHYNYIKPIDSVSVSNNEFTYTNDSLKTDLYFLSTKSNPQLSETFDEGTYLFLRKGLNKLKISKDNKDKMHAEIDDFPLHNQLLTFREEMYVKENRQVLDSLDQLFYAARDKNDMNEMKRLKEESSPYYDQGMQQSTDWVEQQMEANKSSLFGLYLYYTYHFQNHKLSTLDETKKVREYLATLDEEAKQSAYIEKIEADLVRFENCAVGSMAPEITGLDANDKPLKLSDLRGKYVLVDFWASGCSWCRQETPNLAKTYNAFKDKNFTILGVSSDFKKEEWLKAIKEDKTNWDHIILQKADKPSIMEAYAIIGIPEILLVNPEGKIVAKDLRGEDIYTAIAEYIK